MVSRDFGLYKDYGNPSDNNSRPEDFFDVPRQTAADPARLRTFDGKIVESDARGARGSYVIRAAIEQLPETPGHNTTSPHESV